MNTHENWEELLTNPPYCLHVKHEDEYVLLKYDMALSDFNIKLCHEARGAIFRKGNDGKWWCASYGLDKFFNYNEAYSDLKNIDWNNCRVTEKVDGTNIRIYLDNGKWRISTLGCVDAFKAEFINGKSYGDLVVEACGGNFDAFTSVLDKGYCYIFELTGPNRIVINYGDIPYLWYLGRRNQINFKEDFKRVDFYGYPILYPTVFKRLHSLTDCVQATQSMKNDEEGYVIFSVDENGIAHRVKMKGAEYLRLHKLRCNGPLTVVKVLRMWREKNLDDFLSAFPSYQDYVDKVFDAMKKLGEELDHNYDVIIEEKETRKEVAAEVRNYLQPTPAYVFARIDGKETSGINFLQKLRDNNLQAYLSRFVTDDFNKGVIEDV